ncbi:MAG: hypothetical protein ACOCUI_02005 [bacterium]
MKYKPNCDYSFECEILCAGIDAKKIEEKLKEFLKSFIKNKKLKFASLSNESKNKKEIAVKIFSTIEEMQKVIGGKIIHVGRIPDSWKYVLEKEMEEKDEINEKRKMHLDECIMMIINGDKKNYAIIIDRKGIFSISSSPPK